MKFDFHWSDFNETDYMKVTEKDSTERPEDDIYGHICLTVGKEKYIIDVHYEFYSEDEQGFDLEVYTEVQPDGGHGVWIDGIRIYQKMDYREFRFQAEKKVKELLEKESCLQGL